MQVGFLGELTSGGDVGIDHTARQVRLHFGNRLVRRRHNHVAAEQRIRLAGSDAHREDIFWCLRDANVGVNATALLRETGHIQHRDTLILQVRGHTEQRADGDHAGTTNTRHQNAPRAVQ